MRLDQPVELLRELEARSPLEFRVRHTAGDSVVLDVDDEQGRSSAPPERARSTAIEAEDNQRAALNWAADYELGAVAQLAERLSGTQEVGGSSPPSSTPNPES